MRIAERISKTLLFQKAALDKKYHRVSFRKKLNQCYQRGTESSGRPSTAFVLCFKKLPLSTLYKMSFLDSVSSFSLNMISKHFTHLVLFTNNLAANYISQEDIESFAFPDKTIFHKRTSKLRLSR